MRSLYTCSSVHKLLVIRTLNMRLICSQSPTWLPNSFRVPKHLLLITGNGSGPSTPMSSVHIGLPWLNGKNSQYDTWNFFRPHSVTWAYTGTRVVFGFWPYSTEVVFSNSCSAGADGNKYNVNTPHSRQFTQGFYIGRRRSFYKKRENFNNHKYTHILFGIFHVWLSTVVTIIVDV